MAAVIPNSFTRIDLWAMLLPGYVTLIISLLLFYPSSLNIGNDATFNLFAAIVFLVAGPAIGFTLTQFIHMFVYGLWHHERYNFIREYSRVRLNSKDNKNSEFDNIDAKTTFSKSTGLGLVIIASLLILWQPFAYTSLHPLFNQDDDIFRIITGGIIYAVGVLLIIGASLETIHVRDVLILQHDRGKIQVDKEKG